MLTFWAHSAPLKVEPMFALPTPVLEFPRISNMFRGRGVGVWLRNKWPEVLILGLLIPSILGGGGLLYDIVGRLASLEARFAGLDDRVDRIASALPGLKEKIAYEAIYGPFSSAILVADPSQDATGSWGINVGLLNAQDGLLSVYRAGLRGPRDTGGIYAVAGWVRDIDPSAISLEEIERFGLNIEQPVTIPRGLLKMASMISHLDVASFGDAEERKSVGLRLVGSSHLEPVRSWNELSGVLARSAVLR